MKKALNHLLLIFAFILAVTKEFEAIPPTTLFDQHMFVVMRTCPMHW